MLWLLSAYNATRATHKSGALMKSNILAAASLGVLVAAGPAVSQDQVDENDDIRNDVEMFKCPQFTRSTETGLHFV